LGLLRVSSEELEKNPDILKDVIKLVTVVDKIVGTVAGTRCESARGNLDMPVIRTVRCDKLG
jgi:hypothetical protein